MNTITSYTSTIAMYIGAVFTGLALAHILLWQLAGALVFALVAGNFFALSMGLRAAHNKFRASMRNDQ